MNIAVPKVELDATWGSNDPEVERIWSLFKESIKILADRAVGDDGRTQMIDDAVFWADRVYEKLSIARNHYKAVTADDFNKKPKSEQSGEYDSLYAALWSAYKDMFPKMLSNIGYDVSFIFAGDNEFENQANAFMRKYPELEWLGDYIVQQRTNWQNGLRDQRNAKQHDGDLRKMPKATDINNAQFAKHLFNQVCNVIEGVGISAISYKLPPEWGVIVVNEEADVFAREPRYRVKHALEP